MQADPRAAGRRAGAALRRRFDVAVWWVLDALGTLSWRLGRFGRQWGEAWVSEVFSCPDSEPEQDPTVRRLRRACRRAQQATARTGL